ncbi:hypothetical protein [Actinoallomurus rhizosphaericola]|uniref:hypothetical protein n=1 Tax=Actinoallomurus rhizosphaericola TaxID=2952536 RepID=UPI002090A645|nr:hypothetical protein [Actinoallomurus rhizosphaericola]MCO5993368.1 hypothetical protein [Actinoallomurus rhizosphaericola]
MTWVPAQDVMVPALLAALAVTDGAFAGFRAAAGRNARIRRRAYTVTAAGRGAAVALVDLAATAAVSLADLGRRYPALLAAGARMLAVLAPFAVLVVLSIGAYLLLPTREGALMVVVGLGPFTLARPIVVAGAVAAACLGSRDPVIWAAAVTAAVGVLTVEPLVHRRWYREPL